MLNHPFFTNKSRKFNKQASNYGKLLELGDEYYFWLEKNSDKVLKLNANSYAGKSVLKSTEEEAKTTNPQVEVK